MGNSCSSTNRSRQQFQLISQSNHEVFKHITLLKSQVTNQKIAVKQLQFQSIQDIQQYQSNLQLAREYENIPTLVKVLRYQRLGNSKKLKQAGQIKARVIFQYHQSDLKSLLKQKKQSIHEYQLKNPKCSEQCANIQLCNYQQIQSLPPGLKKFINMHFTQIQIIRMIDHLVGAVYFLNHFHRTHQAIRPDTVVIDHEGKYVLADRKIFLFESNFDRAKDTVNLQNQENFYLAPELYENLDQDTPPPHFPQKSDIFSIALIAVQMSMTNYFCLYTVHGEQNKFKFNQMELKRILKEMKKQYSKQFMELLQKMLQIEPIKRINFAQLIDTLNPILSENLKQIQKAYGQVLSNHEQSFSQSCMNSCRKNQNQNKIDPMIYKRIIDIEIKYRSLIHQDQDKEQNNLCYQEIEQNAILQQENRILQALQKVDTNQFKGKGIKNKDVSQIKSSDLYNLYMNQYKSMKNKKVH